MKKVEITVDGVKKELVTELDEEYFETNESEFNDEDTLDLTKDLRNLEDTLIFDKDELNGKSN